MRHKLWVSEIWQRRKIFKSQPLALNSVGLSENAIVIPNDPAGTCHLSEFIACILALESLSFHQRIAFLSASIVAKFGSFPLVNYYLIALKV